MYQYQALCVYQLHDGCLRTGWCWGGIVTVYACEWGYYSTLQSRCESTRTMQAMFKWEAGSLKMNTALEYSTRVVQEGGRRCKKSTLNDLVHLTPLRIPLMNPPGKYERWHVLYAPSMLFGQREWSPTMSRPSWQSTSMSSTVISTRCSGPATTYRPHVSSWPSDLRRKTLFCFCALPPK